METQKKSVDPTLSNINLFKYDTRVQETEVQ